MPKTAFGKKILGWPKVGVIWKLYVCPFHTSDSAFRISQAHKLRVILSLQEDFTHTSPRSPLVNICTGPTDTLSWIPSTEKSRRRPPHDLCTHGHTISQHSKAAEICLARVPASLSCHPSSPQKSPSTSIYCVTCWGLSWLLGATEWVRSGLCS